MTHVLTVVKKEEVNIWVTWWTLHAQGWDVRLKLSTGFENLNCIFVAVHMLNMSLHELYYAKKKEECEFYPLQKSENKFFRLVKQTGTLSSSGLSS